MMAAAGANFEGVTREDIVAAFRAAMIGHFRAHTPGTNINRATLLASDYLNHFHELVMLVEAVASSPDEFKQDLFAWRPLTYEEHFAASGFRDKSLAVAAYRKAPPEVRMRFDEAVNAMNADAVELVDGIAKALKKRGRRKVQERCEEATARLRMHIERTNSIATGTPPEQQASFENGGLPPQAVADALFD
jgi:hypothetical protein